MNSLVDPSLIDPLSLPSVLLADRANLPESPCIYFAIDSCDVIQYIGRSINPQKRWKAHHRCDQLSRMMDVKIAYLFADENVLPAIEEALINWFDPPLNGFNRTANSPPRIRAGVKRDKAIIIRVTEEERESYHSLADSHGRALGEYVRYLLEREKILVEERSRAAES